MAFSGYQNWRRCSILNHSSNFSLYIAKTVKLYDVIVLKTTSTFWKKIMLSMPPSGVVFCLCGKSFPPKWCPASEMIVKHCVFEKVETLHSLYWEFFSFDAWKYDSIVCLNIWGKPSFSSKINKNMAWKNSKR